MLVHKASLLHLLGLRDPCSERPGSIWMLSWSTVGWGLGGCCGAGVLKGRTCRGEPVAVSSSQFSGNVISVPPHHLWDGVCLWHSLLAGSRPNPSLTSPCLGASAQQKLGGSQAWAGGDQNPHAKSPPEQDPGKPLPLTHSLTYSLTPTVPWCGLAQPLIYEPSTWLVVWWLPF